MIISPKFSEMSPVGKKFPKIDKIIRNIFRGIFLQKKFPQGNFPGFVELKHLFTAVNLYFLKVHRLCNFSCDKFVAGQKSFRKVSRRFPETFGTTPG